MFLKSLNLKGFKSFADSTTLDFEPGITVVVGPNGSGKSNIVDAVAWVLGAQGPRTVRSGKMEDVIFAGTAKRPALGRAEVSLTIDNTDGTVPIGFTEVTVTRTLFRNGDSEYAINGVPCRLLDVQELLSDTGVGRQQHVIVSQGQLDAILNARPEDRRSVVEEAAGVLKYRKRRERAQRRLESTEANFVRLGDVLREIRRSLRPLERQAEAARRHEQLTIELRALRLHLAGQELGQLREREVTTGRDRVTLREREVALRSALEALDAAVLTAENELADASGPSGAAADELVAAGLGGMDLTEVLARCEAAHQKARGLLGVLAERRRSLERERDALAQQGAAASLESEAARVADELERVERDAEGLAPQFDALAESERVLADERAKFLEDWGTDTAEPQPGGRTAGAVRSELAAARQAVDRVTGELGRIDARARSLEDRATRLAAQLDKLRTELDELEAAAGDEGTLRVAVTEAAAERAAAEEALAAAEAADASAGEVLRAAEGERRAWQARVDALASALDEARARAGAQRLSGVEGVVGTLLDVVEIADGWAAAFEAAVGEAMAAVVVRDAAAARRALDHLHGKSASGAVLPLAGLSRSGVAGAGVADAPAGAVSVRSKVSSSDQTVAALLDVLLDGVVAVDGSWVDALDLAMARPDLTVVTRKGDRFGVTGWRAGAGSAGATGSALEEARGRAAAATADAERAGNAARAARAALGPARDRARVARERETAAVTRRDRSLARVTTATAEWTRLEADQAEVVTEQAAVVGQRAELEARRTADQARVAALDAELPVLVEAEGEVAQRQRRRREANERLDQRGRAVAALRRDLEVKAAAYEERRQLLSGRVADLEQRLTAQAAVRVEADRRRGELDVVIAQLGRLHNVTSNRADVLARGLQELREHRRRQSEATRQVVARLEGLRRDRTSTEQQLTSVRERLQRAELDETEVRMRLENLTEQIRREFEIEPDAALTAEAPPVPENVSPQTRVRELERDVRLIGPVNNLALDQFNELRERHALIEAQLEDVKTSRRELAKVIKAIDDEIVTVFTAAYADVMENFTRLFSVLFPGGQGELRLTDPENPLDTGIEIEARPSGKNVKKLSLLSGGERSLTAMAFLFAVFRSRPSPFYILDEVEAALDDLNLHRFLTLLEDFRKEAQLLIVSHQKKTMESADCLYGVSMQSGGSSKCVSERLAKAAQTADEA